MKTLKQLRQEKAYLVKEARALLSANKDASQLSAEDTTKYDGIMANIDEVNAAITREEKLAEVERSLTGAKDISEPSNPNAKQDGTTSPRITVTDLEANKPFASFGEQMLAIVEAGKGGNAPDKRLLAINAAATGAGETIPSDGGFLVQQDFSQDVLTRSYNMGELSSRVRRIPIGASANGLKINAVDETSRASGSRYGGVNAYWEGEGDSPSAKKPKFRQMNLRLNKLIGLMYATDELLADGTAFDAVARQAFSEEIKFLVEDAIFEGTGAGQPKGIMNSACKLAITKESGQAAKTIVYQNVLKMWSRMWGRSRKDAVWFINQDAEPQLNAMSINVGTGGLPVYLPANGLADSPFATLFGRPVVPIEYSATLGTEGDIMLADLSQYLMIDKGAPAQAASMHVRFIYDEMAFRIVYRCDGQPIWNNVLTPFKGSNTLSPFVTLAAR